MKKVKINPTAKLLAFDLETSSLDANRGFIICAVAKWVGEKKLFKWKIADSPGYGKTPRSFLRDAYILRGLRPLLEQADAVIAYYGSGFDVPYTNTRCIMNGLKPPAPFTLIDPWKTARSKLKLSRNSMGSVAEALKCKHEKTHLPWKDWAVAPFGDVAAQKRLLEYCANDVHTLEETYLKLRPLITNHPYVGALPASGADVRCPACGGSHTVSDGPRRTRKFVVTRRRCSECGTCFEGGRQSIKGS